MSQSSSGCQGADSMKKFDVYWKSNKDWYFYDGFVPKLKEDAPEEAKKSFEHYLQQKRELYKN